MKAELIHWTELDYQDDNSGLFYGLQLIEDETIYDCYWFANESERNNFIKINNLQICTAQF
jgi:hypothetical protein